MTHPSDLDSVLASIWARRGPQVLIDVQELCHEVEDLSQAGPEVLTKSREKVHGLLGVFGIMQFTDCVELSRSVQAILDELKVHSNIENPVADLIKLAHELKQAVTRRLSMH
jgi:hypothetical protein